MVLIKTLSNLIPIEYLELILALMFGSMFGLMVLTSPYWLFRELVRKEDEQLPTWMGNARSRKKRLTLVFCLFILICGGGTILNLCQR